MKASISEILSFLQELAANNSREWMAANKERYNDCRLGFESIVGTILEGLSPVEPLLAGQKAKDCMFRQHRDVRFSANKSPYKTNMSAVFSKGGKKSAYALWYFHLEPGNASMLAGGIYMPEADILKKVRQEIDYNAGEFENILTHSDFVKYFGEMGGEKLKRAPKGYDVEDSNIEWLKHKSFLATHMVKDGDLVKKEFLTTALQVFIAMKPFNDFLNRAFDG
ncbi:MAG: DUF2461 domain-containing protein [Cyclobacteriaceae bacterium]